MKINKKTIYLLTLLVITLLGFIIIPTYAKFGSNYTTEDDVVAMSLDFDVKISNIEEYEEIALEAGHMEQFNVRITNSTSDTAYYGVWYKMVSPSTFKGSGVVVARLKDSETETTGSINSNESVTVSIVAINNTSNDVVINIGVGNSTTSTSDIKYDDGKKLITGESELGYKLLKDVDSGSYVSFLGTNGCFYNNGSCSGTNANYVSTTDMGYCSSSTYKYTVNGWRVAFSDDDSVSLISAASPECMCTNSNGTTSNSSCSSNETTSGTPLHMANLDNKALTYCNKDYAYGGVCSSNTAYNFNESNYQRITGSTISSCSNVPNNTACGYNNDLIDVGGYYWMKESTPTTGNTYCWWEYVSHIGNNFMGGNSSNHVYGIRPVLKLRSDIMVLDGDGTSTNPYRIASPDNKVHDLSGNGNHGINRVTTWNKAGGTITTNGGQDSFVDAGLANYDFGSNATIIVRAKLNSIDTSLTESNFFGNWEYGGLGLYIKSNKLAFNVHTDSGYSNFISTTAPTTDTWYTLVGTYNGTNLSLYINGQAATLDSSGVSTATGNITPSGVPFAVGGNMGHIGALGLSSGSFGPVNATFDDVLIFDRALSASEISSNYSDEINVTDYTDLLVYYDFYSKNGSYSDNNTSPDTPSASVTSIEYLSGPTKKEYYSDESLNTDGLKIKVNYDDGSSETVDASSSVTNYTTNSTVTSGTRHTLTISYAGKTATATTYKYGWYGGQGTWYYYKNNGTAVTGDNVSLPFQNRATVNRKFYMQPLMYMGWRGSGTSWRYYLMYDVASSKVDGYTTYAQAQSLSSKSFGLGSMLTDTWGYIYASATNHENYFWYYFGSDGYAKTGWWQNTDGHWYYFRTRTNEQSYGPIGSMYKGAWLDESANVYYYLRKTANQCGTGPEGSMVANTTCTVDGKTWTFNSSGVCIAGGC